MPKYKVMRPIEHNYRLYVPQAGAAPEKAKSAGHGQEIPVDFSGTIELDSNQAATFINGQIAALEGSPTSGADSKGARR